MKCEEIEEIVRKELGESIRVSAFTDQACLIRLPFWDNYGDPIEMTVASDGSQTIIDDGGAIAALLFSLGQHTSDTPMYKLLRNLEQTHGFELDFNEGLIRISVPDRDIYDGIAELTKIVLSLHTVAPHIRVAPRRIRPLGGRRLKTRIREGYRSLGIFELVETDSELDGATIRWPVDFHWSVGIEEEESYNVYVLATDLNVAEPLQRAQSITAFSMDALPTRHQDGLRIVMEAPKDNVLATEAARFLRHHSQHLQYKVFDFGLESERSDFFDISEVELLGDAGAPWRKLMETRRATVYDLQRRRDC